MHDAPRSREDKSELPSSPASPPCPFCDGTDTEVISPFGGQLSVSQCWCYRCRTGFDYFKWEDQETSLF